MVHFSCTITATRALRARFDDTRYTSAVRMPAISKTVPPAVNTFKLKVAEDKGFPSLFRTSRPGQANFQPECAALSGVPSRKSLSGPNEVRVKSATTIRYGAKAIKASRLDTGPDPAVGEPVPPLAPGPAGPTGCKTAALSAGISIGSAEMISDGCHTR